MRAWTAQWWSACDMRAMRSSTWPNSPATVTDEEVLREANTRRAVLLTADKDFEEGRALVVRTAEAEWSRPEEDAAWSLLQPAG
ncbi:MAG TPA: hypothetical protein DCQ64_15775 [Candidatus Rokubacteria bacterium]|nr:MAG: hypothetical protein A2X53_20025 [Candidatus Rokubacteria bacterium GWA2_70_23]HAM56770.1 hypothetical protein [Candidatus Rokubacteria bacterium]